MGTGPPNLFTTVGRHRKLLRGWLRFAGRLMPRGRLPRRDTELVILRVAHLRECAYEWDHHVRLGRRAGVGQDELRRITEGPEAEGWSAREQAILAAVEQLHSDRDVDDETWARLRSHLDERELIELVFLVGHYEMLATAIGTLRIQVDRRR
jgi:AhpD family alkylhydroperoxidase